MRKGKTLYHCHGSAKGKVLSRHKTVKKAKAAHHAIAISKKRKRR